MFGETPGSPEGPSHVSVVTTKSLQKRLCKPSSLWSPISLQLAGEDHYQPSGRGNPSPCLRHRTRSGRCLSWSQAGHSSSPSASTWHALSTASSDSTDGGAHCPAPGALLDPLADSDSWFWFLLNGDSCALRGLPDLPAAQGSPSLVIALVRGSPNPSECPLLYVLCYPSFKNSSTVPRHKQSSQLRRLLACPMTALITSATSVSMFVSHGGLLAPGKGQAVPTTALGHQHPQPGGGEPASGWGQV